MSRAMEQQDSEPYSEINFLRDIGLATTLHCQASCPHCIVRAGPKRKEKVLEERAMAWIDQIAAYRGGHIRALALTGGEPFSDLDHLAALSNHAAERGLLVTAVTNCYWAESKTAAVDVLDRMANVKVLTFSTDVYHQRTIPPANLANAIEAARELGRRYIVAVCRRGRVDPETDALIEGLKRMTPPESINSPQIFPVGRARSLHDRLGHERSSQPPAEACTMAHAPVIFPDGKVVACFGPIVAANEDTPLVLGHLKDESLASILDRADANPILHAVRLWGPRELIRRVISAGLGRHLPSEYISGSVCSACYELMTNAALTDYLAALAKDEAFFAEVAYGRVYYLGETSMAELCSPEGSEPQPRGLAKKSPAA